MINKNAADLHAPAEVRVHFPRLDSPTFVPIRYRPGNHRTWSGHLPFARDLVAALRPGMLVELGTHHGESYFGFCQSVDETAISCACYAVDTWRGDSHAGEYGEEVYQEVEQYNRDHYHAFSYLLRTTFDDALPRFSDESIDLLHIDGLHTYEAVTHDWEQWFPKVAPGGIVLLHDIAVRHADFGVWKLWAEISQQHESFDFHHSFGLGVIRKSGGRKVNGEILAYLFNGDNAEQLRRHYVLCAERLDAKADLAAVNQRAYAPVFQVYYPRGGQYSEGASVQSPLTPGGWQRLTFELSHGIDGSSLRLDPADRAALIDIGSVSLFHAFDRQELWRCRPQGEDRRRFELGGTAWAVPLDRYLEVFSYGADPQVHVAIPDIVPRGEPLILECWVRLHEDFSDLAREAQNWVEVSRTQADTCALETAPTLLGTLETVADQPSNSVSSLPLCPDTVDGGIDSLTDQAPPDLTGREFVILPFEEPTQWRNDWVPASGEVNTWSATTHDPWIVFPADFDVGAFRFFVIIMSCRCEFEPEAQVFWSSKDRPGFDEGRSVRFRPVADGTPHIYVLDLHASGLWPDSGQVEFVRLDPINSPGSFTIPLAGFVHKNRKATDCVYETSHPIAFLQPEGSSGSLLDHSQPSVKSPARNVTRQDLARKYFHGSGIEIGALQHPLPMPRGVEIKYVDRLTVHDARKEFPELGDLPLVTPSIITNADTLAEIADESYDFCVACNVIEHLRDPIGALEHWLRVLKPGGILFLECPDHTNFMDRLRPVTTLDHLIADHEHREDRAELDRHHYFESVKSTHHQLSEEECDAIAERYFAISYAVHFHTFDEDSFGRLLKYMTTRVRFTVEEAHVLLLPEIVEFVAILRKAI